MKIPILITALILLIPTLLLAVSKKERDEWERRYAISYVRAVAHYPDALDMNSALSKRIMKEIKLLEDDRSVLLRVPEYPWIVCDIAAVVLGIDPIQNPDYSAIQPMVHDYAGRAYIEVVKPIEPDDGIAPPLSPGDVLRLDRIGGPNNPDDIRIISVYVEGWNYVIRLSDVKTIPTDLNEEAERRYKETSDRLGHSKPSGSIDKNTLEKIAERALALEKKVEAYRVEMEDLRLRAEMNDRMIKMRSRDK